MILIADGGSTKADWIAIDSNGKQVFKERTLGLNPAVLAPQIVKERMINNFQLMNVKDEVDKVFFYGAGCGTPKPKQALKEIFEDLFTEAEVMVEEDMLAAVYAAGGIEPSIVCILGTGSNSCYFDGEFVNSKVASLGYVLMDEASGNYFGKRLLRDYFYDRMPKHISKAFSSEFNLNEDEIKMNLYKKPNPNAYLASFCKFIFDYRDEEYTKQLMDEGFDVFIRNRVLCFNEAKDLKIHFIGSIAYFFIEILDAVAKRYGLSLGNVIRRPIGNLVDYHKENLI